VSQGFDIRVRGHRLRAKRFGSRDAPLVLGLPGLSGNVESFGYLGERIGRDGLQVVAIDWRGRGRSETTGPGTYGLESHALDALAVAEDLGFATFGVIGQSMGGSVGMKIAQLASRTLVGLVLLDVAGRVDRGIGAVIADSLARLDKTFASADEYVAAVQAHGLVQPWSDHWERLHRYELEEAPAGVRPRTNTAAVAEDRAYTATQDPYDRWNHLTMPTLLLRASRELRPGSGHVVPTHDRDLFRQRVPHAVIVEVDANHLTINAHPDTPKLIKPFLHHALHQRPESSQATLDRQSGTARDAPQNHPSSGHRLRS
jgi:pimeloyl-ACP methyl ester carboxylesterase